jgi:hypothetical protein
MYRVEFARQVHFQMKIVRRVHRAAQDNIPVDKAHLRVQIALMAKHQQPEVSRVQIV